MGPPGSCLALGSVALGPPDKMGSAVGVLAKAGQKGRRPRVQGWGDRSCCGVGDGSGLRLVLGTASREPRGG